MTSPDHFRAIYSRRAADYHRLITPEDADGQLGPALERVAPVAGRHVLDLGTGTGRLPLLLHPRAARLTALDLHRAMLTEQARLRAASGGAWALAQGDMRALPLPDACADVVTAGWAIGHWCGWQADDWQTPIGRILREMRRVAASGGVLVILETLGTGALRPAPPTPNLAAYYAWLENTWGFQRAVLRTDYQFPDAETAAAQTEFFFGPELAATIRARGWARLPEWTGLWWRAAESGPA